MYVYFCLWLCVYVYENVYEYVYVYAHVYVYPLVYVRTNTQQMNEGKTEQTKRTNEWM